MVFFAAALYPRAMAFGQSRPIRFTGICNASGAVAVGGGAILVGDDEISALSIYREYRNSTAGRYLSPAALA